MRCSPRIYRDTEQSPARGQEGNTTCSMRPRLSCTAGSAAPGWGTRWRGPRSPGLVPGPRRDLAHRRASCRHRVPALPSPRRPGSVPARRRRAVLRRPLAPAPPPHPTPLPTCRPRPPRLVTQRHHTTAQRLGYSAGRCASSRPDRRPLNVRRKHKGQDRVWSTTRPLCQHGVMHRPVRRFSGPGQRHTRLIRVVRGRTLEDHEYTAPRRARDLRIRQFWSPASQPDR